MRPALTAPRRQEFCDESVSAAFLCNGGRKMF